MKIKKRIKEGTWNNLNKINNKCLVSGWGCGYIGVPEDHPWFGRDKNEIEADVHGGLTYGKIENDGLCWFGFDTAHGFLTDFTKWTKKEVGLETNRLYQQAMKAT